MVNKKKFLINGLIHIAAILLFLGISVTYFSPELGGKVLPQGDVTQFKSSSKELKDYSDNEGQTSEWTNSLFSGMPSYQIGVWGGSPNLLDYVEAPVRALGSNIGPVFTGMLMAYILFLLIGCSPLLSILGAIAYSLGSYNIIILGAGHINKAWAIAYMPLVVASMLVLFKRKYLLSGVLMALGLALQIKSNHLQVTYYIGLLCIILFVALAIELIRAKQIKDLLKASGILAIAVTIALCCNMGNIYSNYEMGQESTRGKSELAIMNNLEEKKSTGLDKDYAFSWSYGKSETLSLLIPNIHGGASGGMLDSSSHLYKELAKNGQSQMITPKGVQAYTYWGDQPFTEGPVYFGAIICFLFLLGMLVIRNNVKWALLIATIFFLFLSWGRHFDFFNHAMFHYLPMYNKFRTVSAALVIPAITMLIVAIWGVKEIFTANIAKEKLIKSLYIAAGITGGISLFFWIAPGFFFNFTVSSDGAWMSQVPDWFYQALLADRKDMLSSDAFRSLSFIVLAAALLWIAINSKEKNKSWGIITYIGLIVLVIIDLWGVDKRYLSEDNFVDEKDYKQTSFTPSDADKFILLDKGISYRVLNTQNPFNENTTSYFHKSIGGYHAAKLKRYQELIDHHLQREVSLVKNEGQRLLEVEIAKMNSIPQDQAAQLDMATVARSIEQGLVPVFQTSPAMAMLNTRYVIIHPNLPPIRNRYALGNAWFVNEYKIVENADAEMKALSTYSSNTTVVVDKRFAQQLDGLNIQPDSTATIVVTELKANRIKYKTHAAREQLALLSEIYYAHGWQAYVDGKPVDHMRANWTLRAMRIPAGDHEVEFKFEPKSYRNARMLATASSGFLLLLVLGVIVYSLVRKEKVA